MAISNLGKTVIDELRLCFTADIGLLKDLRSIGNGESQQIGDFYFHRIECKHFGVGFNIYISGNEPIASLKFDRYGELEASTFVYYRMDNHILYDPDKFRIAMTIPDRLGLFFNNITAIDLAQDFSRNICNVIRRLYKDKSVTAIINGKAIKDRQQILPNLSIIYATTLNKLKNPTLYIKQTKALHDKSKGVTLCAYNKAAEIRNSSDKQYVLDYYGNPKRLHRLEIRLNSCEIKDYCTTRGIVQRLDLVSNYEFLTDLFMYHLSSVLRFTKGRNKVPWNDILCNGRTI